MMALLLFLLPSKPNFIDIFRTNRPNSPITSSPGLISWSIVEKKMPWGVILLFGGGFAVAAGSDSSGLSDWIGEQLEGQGLFNLLSCNQSLNPLLHLSSLGYTVLQLHFLLVKFILSF